jgi:hypothetical protein
MKQVYDWLLSSGGETKMAAEQLLGHQTHSRPLLQFIRQMLHCRPFEDSVHVHRFLNLWILLKAH